MSDEAEVAKWMMEQVTTKRTLDQDYAVYKIERLFGSQFVYINDNGGTAISRKVLAEFRKLSGDKVIWERGDKLWRLRQKYDVPGRAQE